MDRELSWVRVAAISPQVAVGQPRRNGDFILAKLAEIDGQGVDLAVFPELCLTGYTCGDLFHHELLLREARTALLGLLEATAGHAVVFAVGLPLAVGGQLFNCAAVAQAGRLLGIVPKSVIPNYREFYEQRWFAPAARAREESVALGDFEVPFGSDLLFVDERDSRFTFGVEMCEDLWAPIPASTRLALGGATVLLNLSASHELVGKSDYRRQLILQQSGRCLAAYAYSSAGPLESTTDLVFGGHCMIAENACMLSESSRFQRGGQVLVADVDVEFLARERRQNHAFNSQVGEPDLLLRKLGFAARPSRMAPTRLFREVNPLPFVPADPKVREERCREIMAIQSHGLATRLQKTGIRRAVLGLSGGLDSTLALLVALEAFEHLELPPENLHCLTMPGFGTSERTLRQVREMTAALGLEVEEIDIRPACRQHLADLRHDGETGDTAFENAQARERTQILMDKANMVGGLVVGTGDLSELALGWVTYSGDHMSMYAVNIGVPKTLVAYLVREFAASHRNRELAGILGQILETPISPELLPADASGNISQKTEESIGPYELHDFFLHHLLRCGFAPGKVRFLATVAFAGKYEEKEIDRWLKVFIGRFFRQQFKRSCLPDGPKVGTIALSPRGDWRMPSDADPQAWLDDLA